MPRNGSSVYSLPAGNPVIPGTVIATTWANTTLTDIATALTNSLSTDGSTASVSLSGKTMSGGTFSGPSVTGILTLTGGQIEFPAVQVPSSNANTLDDYEEGTWTPAIFFATPGNTVLAYTRQVGTYTKIGRSVEVGIDLVTSTFTHTTASGNAGVSGLPYLPASNQRSTAPMQIDLWAFGAGYTSALLAVTPALSTMSMVTIGTGVVTGTLTASGHTTGNNTVLYSSLTYFTN